MSVDKQKALLFSGAAAVRLLLFVGFPSLPDLLTGRVEISTPVTSFKRLQEGLFLYTHNVSPYDGGIFHQAPLLLPLFSLLPNPSTYPLATSILYILLDLLSANALIQIAESGQNVVTRLFASPRREQRWSSTAIAAGFLFNPLTILSCIARPTSIFTNFFVLQAIAKAASGLTLTAILALALASYLSLYPILLLPPLLLLSYDGAITNRKRTLSGTQFAIIHVGLFALAIGALLFISYLLTGGSWEFVASTYGVQLLLPDLTPNVGLWWYFFIEMFDSFREFFLGVFWLHMASYVGGLSFRLHKQPLFVITALVGIFAIFQPYPSIADSTLYLALVPLYRHVFSTFLGPAFYYLWIYAGSGNANFFYAITLVWSLGLSVIVADSLYAVLRDEWEVERPEMRGKEVKQI